MLLIMSLSYFFFFNDTATTEIYTLSLHDALPISRHVRIKVAIVIPEIGFDDVPMRPVMRDEDRKSTRLNSSHSQISYAVFCLKKKKKYIISIRLLIITRRIVNIQDTRHIHAVHAY